MKVIFLDVDGVLNGYNYFTKIKFNILDFLHLRKWHLKHFDLFGVHTIRVWRLSKIVRRTGAKVVISSTWRHGWFRPYESKGRRDKELEDKLRRFKIPVIGITPRINSGKRGLEIQMWLAEHSNVESFVILDDESFDIEDLYKDQLVKTRARNIDMIKGAWKENTGIKPRHVRQAIRILNKK